MRSRGHLRALLRSLHGRLGWYQPKPSRDTKGHARAGRKHHFKSIWRRRRANGSQLPYQRRKQPRRGTRTSALQPNSRWTIATAVTFSLRGWFLRAPVTPRPLLPSIHHAGLFCDNVSLAVNTATAAAAPVAVAAVRVAAVTTILAAAVMIAELLVQ